MEVRRVCIHREIKSLCTQKGLSPLALKQTKEHSNITLLCWRIIVNGVKCHTSLNAFVDIYVLEKLDEMPFKKESHILDEKYILWQK
jgi:hypothetical protein